MTSKILAIQSGKLIYPVEIQRGTTTLTEGGAKTTTWAKFFAGRAELVERAASDEQKTDFGRLTRETILLRLRWINGVTLSDRIIFDDEQPFRIVKIAEIGFRRGLEIVAERFKK